MTDRELIAKYASEKDQGAFAELVRRHLGWAYSSARRLVRDQSLAEDVVQAAFILLSRKAGALSSRSHVAGWLFRTTHYCAREAMRREATRQKHEREAAMQRQSAGGADEVDWEQVWPALDEAVGRLRRKDRDAVLLRFYQGMSMAELAAAEGIGEEAAKKRVQRAVEKLRGMLEKQGVTGTSAGLSAVLVGNAVQEVPSTLLDGVMKAVGGSGGSAVAAGIAGGATKMMAWAGVKVVAVVIVLGTVLPLAAFWAAESSAASLPAKKELIARLHAANRMGQEAMKDVRIIADVDVSQNPEVMANSRADGPLQTTVSYEYERKGAKERRLTISNAQVVRTAVYDGQVLLEYYPLTGERDSQARLGRSQRMASGAPFAADKDGLPQILLGGSAESESLFAAKDVHVVCEEPRNGIATVRLACTMDVNRETYAATAWFSPERDGLLVAAELRDAGSAVAWDWEVSAYDRLASGRWFPKVVVQRLFAKLGAKHVESTVSKWTVREVTLNPKVDEGALFSSDEGAVPPGYFLNDAVSGRAYTVGERTSNGK